MTREAKKSMFEDKGGRRAAVAARVWTRSITSMRILSELAVDHGLPLSTVLAGTGVGERELGDPLSLVLPEQELRLIRNLLRGLPGVPALGVEAGLRYRFTAFGMLGFAMVAAPDVRTVLDLALRYFNLTFAFTRFEVAAGPVQTVVTVSADDVPADLRRFVLERDCAALVRVRRDLDPGATPAIDVGFSWPAPRDLAPYRAAFGFEPGFGRAATTIRLETRDLARPLATADAAARAAAEEQCRLLLDRRHARSGLALMIRDRLVRDCDRMPTMETVADDLCTTVRTLRRRLEEEGTTFARIRGEVREALAEELLATTSLTIEAISERLGYAEPTCFINAFKSWRGLTPFAWRRRRGDEPPA